MFRTYSLPLQRFATSLAGSAALAEELVQDVFVALWTKREALALHSTLQAYLYAATRNRALSLAAHQKVRDDWAADEARRLAETERDAVQQPSESFEVEEFTRVVRRTVEALPSRRRAIYEMSRDRRMSYAEIAAALDISTKTIEAQMTHALRAIREALVTAGWAVG